MFSEFPKTAIVDPHWEILLLEDGTAFFDNIYGDSLLIANVSEAIRFFLTRIVLEDSIVDILNHIRKTFRRSDTDSVRALIRKLFERGVLTNTTATLDFDLDLLSRFQTQIDWLAGFGKIAGQDAFQKLRTSTVALVGLGGAGSLCAMMLAAAGIGRLKLIDGDQVAESNLVRQIFYTEHDARLGRLKVDTMAERIRIFSRHTQIERHAYFVTDHESALSAIAGVDLIIQTADRPRILLNRIINRACCLNRVPYIYSFVDHIGPMYIPNRSACFACLEEAWRDEFGPKHDMVVDALQSVPPRNHPSVVSGATQIADAIFHDAIGLLSGAFLPKTVNARIRPSCQVVLPCECRVGCPACGVKYRRRP